VIYTVLVMLLPNGPVHELALARQSGWITHDDFPGSSVEDLNELYKLDKPWPLNYFVWLFDPGDDSVVAYNEQNIKVRVPKGIDLEIGNLSIRGSGALTGDFGEAQAGSSLSPVSDIIGARWPNSLFLFLMAFVMTLVVGVPLGIVGAIREGKLSDHAMTVLSLGGVSIPPYVLSYLLILFLAIGLKSLHDRTGWDWVPWFPAGGFSSDSLWDRAYYVVLPALALAIPQIARVARHTRFALIEVLQKDYIRTARAKGLGLRTVIFKHALRNSLVPIIAQLALFVPIYVSAAAPVENAFDYSGLGRQLYIDVGGCAAVTGITPSIPPPCSGGFVLNLYTPMVLPLLLIMVVLIALSTLVADILYLIVDPKVSFAAKGKMGQ
jgi:peptide/nickel transport system permease protein